MFTEGRDILPYPVRENDIVKKVGKKVDVQAISAKLHLSESNTHMDSSKSFFFIDGMYNHTHLVKHLLIHYYSPFNEYNNFTTAAVSAST